MSREIEDLAGQIFGRLVVLEFAYIKNKRTNWLCRCSCSVEKIIAADRLKRGKTRSCGCLRLEVIKKINTKHGMRKTRFYKIWSDMIQRCTNPNNPRYKDYGGRGITVCKRWLESFENFYTDNYSSYLESIIINGEKNTTADRYPNVNGNYEPSNFKWATWEEQSHGTRKFSKTINYKEHCRQRSLFSQYLNMMIKSTSNSKLFEYRFGISLEDFKIYIESLFLPDMTWGNHGYGMGKWNFDHIVGCNNFDLSIEKERLECNYYKNLRPMWHKDHVQKNKNKILVIA